MEIGHQLNHQVQCRLCGFNGDHLLELFDLSSGRTSSTWSEKIFRCLDIQVEPSDSTTVICNECAGKLRDIDIYRDICHATNNRIKNAHPHLRSGVTNNVIVKSNVRYETVTEPIVECISLVDSDSESEEAANEMEFPGNSKPAESSADEIFVFVSTSSTPESREYPEIATIPSNLEMVSDEQIVKPALDARGNESASNVDWGEDDLSIISVEDNKNFLFDISESDLGTDTKTDSDGMGDVARISRKKKDKKRETRSSIPKITIKKLPNVNMKPMKIASEFPVKCSFNGLCSQSFESRIAMKLHVETYHKNRAERSFCCHLCKQTVATKQNLEKHMNAKHTQLVRFMCPNRDCSRIFPTNWQLKSHFNIMHKNKVTFRCTKCSKAFAREHLLKKHLAIAHGKGIAFVCYLCEKSFTMEHNLRIHIEVIHTHVRRYKCPEAKCSKSFNRKSNMKAHFYRAHSQKTVYKCTKCSTTFSWKRSLHNHLALKH